MEVRSSNNIEASPMELYIHIPFCIRKCDYCDFLSGPSDPGKRAAYVQALLKEIQAVKAGRGRSVSSIFIGGGTPSVLDEKFMGEILREIRKDFKLQEDHDRSKSRYCRCPEASGIQKFRDQSSEYRAAVPSGQGVKNPWKDS